MESLMPRGEDYVEKIDLMQLLPNYDEYETG